MYKKHISIKFIKPIIAMGIISGLTLAFLSIFSYVAMKQEIQAGEKSAAIINIAGRQRMLLKSTALCAIQIGKPWDRDNSPQFRNELLRQIDDMEKSHNILTAVEPLDGLPVILSEETKSLYFSPPLSLDMEVKKYIAEVRKLLRAPKSELSHGNPHVLNILEMGRADLSAKLDKAVQLLQKESEVNTEKLHLLEKIILVVSIIILLSMGVFLFIPLTRRLLQETEMLEKSESSLTSAQRIAHLGSWEWKIEENTLHWSDETYNIFGMRKDEREPSYEIFLNCVHPEDREFVEKSVEATLNDKKPYKIDHRINRPDGSVRIVHEEAEVIFDGTGKAISMSGTAQDITERKLAEDELDKYRKNLEQMVKDQTDELLEGNQRLVMEALERDEAEEKFRVAFDNANTGMCLIDLHERLVEVNSKICEIFGYNKEELKKMRVNDISHPEDKKFSELFIKEALAGKITQAEFETRYIHKDGSVIWGHVSIALVRDSEDKFLYFIAQVQDISQRKQAEEELRRSREKYDLAMNVSRDGIWDRDLVTGETYYSPHWKKILGYNDGELPNNHEEWTKRLHPDDFDRVMGDLEDYFEGKARLYMCEYRLRHKNGSYRWVMARGAAIKDENGKPIRFAGSLTDITDHKREEDEVMKSQKLESVGILAGGIAHDFNNILTSVIGNIFLAKESLNEKGEVYEMLESVEKESMRAKHLTQQLLTFSKEGVPIVKKTTIANLLKETAGFALRGSNVKAEISIPDDLWVVEVDEGQISQVINNLVINAEQAMPGGGIVKIGAENIDVTLDDDLLLKEGKYVMLAISDEGEGIEEGDLDKIFDPYFSTKEMGSGLGLATTYSIIKRHNGYISVDSEVGSGATFYVYLPALKGKLPTPEMKEDVELEREGRVLILEDEEAIIEMINAILVKTGYKVVITKDGKDTLDQYKKARESGKSFDIVMVDLTIPGGMGGMETIKRLKKIDPNVKAIVCSGYSDSPAMSNYKDYGFCDSLPKPYHTRELKEKLHKVINS